MTGHGPAPRGRVATRLHTLVWLLPASRAKNRLLRRFGHEIAADAHLGPCLVPSLQHARIGAGAIVGVGNLIRGLHHLVLDDRALIGPWNIITAHPVFQAHDPAAGDLRLGRETVVTTRHSIDCSGSVRLGAFASVAGHQTQMLSHQVDFTDVVQTCAPIEIGDHAFVGTRCTVLAGARLPDRSVLAAGSVLTRAREHADPGLYSGNPARRTRDIDGGWFHRAVGVTQAVRVNGTGEIVRDAVDIPNRADTPEHDHLPLSGRTLR